MSDLPTKPDPRLIEYRDHGEPGVVATAIFCAFCIAIALTAISWVIFIAAGG